MQPTAQVYVNWGRVIADCWCGDARQVEIGQPTMTCCVGNGCPGHLSDLIWPDNLPEILAVLAERTSDKRKNWFPLGHPLAVSANLPQGQTPDELRAEAEAGEAADAQLVADEKASLIARLRELKIPDDDIIADIRRAV